MEKDDAVEALKKCIDPELNIDVWTLGLIYGIDIKDKKIKIRMTFTSPMCPYGPVLIEDVKNNLSEAGFAEVDVEIVFDPPWQPSDELREMLGV